jgi:hypothetical protein
MGDANDFPVQVQFPESHASCDISAGGAIDIGGIDFFFAEV